MKLSIKGIMVGGITDVILSSLLGGGLSVYVIATNNYSALPKDQLSAAAISTVHASTLLYAVQLVIGFSCSVLGGYIAARIAKQHELVNAALASWLCVGIGIYSIAMGHSQQSLASHILLIALTLVAYVGGGFLFCRSNKHES